MKSLTEKLAYIQGLCEGLELDGETKEGKVLLAMVDLLDDLTDTVSQLDSDIDEIYEEIDAIDEDLTDVEDALLGDDEEDEECGCCGHHHHHEDEDEDEIYDEENPIYEITCPKCGEVVCMDEEMLFSPDCACPNCGTSFEIEFDDECDCEECSSEEEK